MYVSIYIYISVSISMYILYMYMYIYNIYIYVCICMCVYTLPVLKNLNKSKWESVMLYLTISACTGLSCIQPIMSCLMFNIFTFQNIKASSHSNVDFSGL